MKIKTDQEAKLGYWLILPTVLLIGGLIFYPIFYNIWLSLHNVSMNPAQPNIFIGLENFSRVLSDNNFWSSFGTSLIFTVTTVIGTTVFGLGVAILLNRKFPGRAIFRGLILLPYVTPVISSAFGWRYFFSPVYGIFNYLLVDILNILPQHINWVQSPRFAIFAVIIYNIWRNFPFAFLMILAELQSIPVSLYEAAEVDGATALDKFYYITLPSLKFVIGALVILRTIWNFYKFDEVYLLSSSVNVLPVYIYERAFATYNFGQAAAISAILFVFLFGFILFYLRKVLKW